MKRKTTPRDKLHPHPNPAAPPTITIPDPRTLGRPSKYTAELEEELLTLLAAGCIVEDVCAKVGISKETFYSWQATNAYFLDAVTRARAAANTNATLSLRRGMDAHDIVTKTVKKINETKLRPVVLPDGTRTEETYIYEKTEETVSTTRDSDWRAAMEYLKRRDPKNWAERLIIQVDAESEEILAQHGLTPKTAWLQFMQMLRNILPSDTLNQGIELPQEQSNETPPLNISAIGILVE